MSVYFNARLTKTFIKIYFIFTTPEIVLSVQTNDKNSTTNLHGILVAFGFVFLPALQKIQKTNSYSLHVLSVTLQ